MVIDAERFKAAVNKPAGMIDCNVVNENSVNHGEHGFMNRQTQLDEEFLHLTCHVDVNLIGKIEKGEFVDLEKLLPKDPTQRLTNENRMELVNREGLTYFVPTTERDRIMGIRKWEQAFRVYATIYSRANPHRSSEIWQYVYTINLAANSYIWENIACYDFTFRPLMARHPECSWSAIYHQMWSLAMREPIIRTGTHNRAYSNNGGGDANVSGTREHRTNYCWKFNKNRCKFGSRCRYEHCCNYCDGFGHGVFNCS